MKHVIFFWNRLYYGIFDYNRLTQIFIYRIFVRLLSCFLHKKNVVRRDKMIILNKNAISALSDTKCSTVLMIADVTMLAFTALLI